MTTTFHIQFTNVKLLLCKKSYDYSAELICTTNNQKFTTHASEVQKQQYPIGTTDIAVKANTEGKVVQLSDTQVSFPNQKTSTTTITVPFILNNKKTASNEIKSKDKTQDVTVSSSPTSYSVVFGEVGSVNFNAVVVSQLQLDVMEEEKRRKEKQRQDDEEAARKKKLLEEEQLRQKKQQKQQKSY